MTARLPIAMGSDRDGRGTEVVEGRGGCGEGRKWGRSVSGGEKWAEVGDRVQPLN